jgi:hypothetical protein
MFRFGGASIGFPAMLAGRYSVPSAEPMRQGTHLGQVLAHAIDHLRPPNVAIASATQTAQFRRPDQRPFGLDSRSVGVPRRLRVQLAQFIKRRTTQITC